MSISDDFYRLLDNLRIRVPGATDDVLKLELFNVLNEFFQDSNCWFNDVEFTVTSGVTEYTVTPAGVSSPVRLVGVVNSDLRPQRAVFDLPSTITLQTAPVKAEKFTARIVLTVDDPVTTNATNPELAKLPVCPDWAINKYGVDIQDGVLGRMMSQIAKPYTNERMAIYHMRRFRGAVAQARVEAMHNNIYRGQNWSFPQSFARRRAR